jgi:hypothetical protein
VRCLFCASDIDDAAAVCPSCQRDVAVPPSLLAERDELLGKRDRLISYLAEARARLAARSPFRLGSRV